MTTPLELEHLTKYIERWKKKIWKLGFGYALKKANTFRSMP